MNSNPDCVSEASVSEASVPEASGPAGPICPLVTRRTFIAGLGAAVLTTACGSKNIAVYEQAGSGNALTSGPTARTVATVPPATAPSTTSTTQVGQDFSSRTLVVVELGGGNDSLSMVVPHAQDRYYDLRGDLAITDPLDLDGQIGLHPSMTNLAAAYAAGDAALVDGVGMHTPDLSHFISMRRWWDGTEQPDNTGWLGRYLDRTAGYERLLAGITIGPGPSQAMLGRSSFVVNISDAYGLHANVPWWVDNADEFIGTWAGFAPVDVPVRELTPLQGAISGTVTAQNTLSAGLEPLRTAIEAGEIEHTWGLTDQLRLAAHLIAGGIAPDVIYVHGQGDFDTHNNQLSRHGELMADLDRGIGVFWDTLAASEVDAEDVVLMTTSEFGRRPESVEGGTDHGTAGISVVMGPAVTGGHYGEAPSLRRLDDTDNLLHTVDFRSLYASVLDSWLGADADDILGKGYERLPLFA